MNSSALSDIGSLNCEESMLGVQPFWDLVRTLEPWAHVPFFPAVFNFGLYLSYCLPYLALDFLSIRFPALKKYKIHPEASPTLGTVAHCLAQSIYQHIICIFPATMAYFYWRPLQFPQKAPELSRLLLDVVACLLVFDFLYFLWHVLHHKVPWLYKTFHKFHHKHVSTFALATQYSSSWELAWQAFFTLISPILAASHPFGGLVFFVVSIWISVEDHCGYDLPWAIHRLVPWGLIGGAPHHDLHHRNVRCNYAPYFKHWDRIFGTLSHAVEVNGSPVKDNKDR